MNSHVGSRYWFKILRSKHFSGDGEGIKLTTRREGKNKIFYGILFVVIGNGIGKVDGIGRIGQQLVFQLHYCLFPDRPYHRHSLLRWGNDHLLCRRFDLDIFIKLNLNPRRSSIQRMKVRRSASHFRRIHIVGSSRWSCHVCAGLKQNNAQYRQKEKRKQ